MMRTVFFVVAVAAFANCFEVNRKFLNFEREKRNSTEPQKCCLPNEYSCLLIQLDALPSKVEIAMQVSYDMKQLVMLNYTAGSKVLIDYKKGVIYTVPTNNPKVCYKAPFTMPQVKCIPDDAVYLGSSYVGPGGKDELMYDAWQFNLNEYTITITTTRLGCVPIVESVYTPNAGKQLFHFAGYQPHLTDPTAFELPPSCNQ